MPSAYPGALDSLPTTRSGSALVGPDVLEAASSINAIEAELGINPSGPSTTLAARLAQFEQTALASPAPSGTPAQQRTALIAWMDALVATGRPGYLIGNYVISAEIQRFNDNFTIIGADWVRSSITLDPTVSQNQRVLQFNAATGLTLSRFRLTHNNTGRNAAGFALDLVGECRRTMVHGLEITGASAAIRSEALKDSWLLYNWIHDTYSDGIHLDNGPATTFADNVEVAGNFLERVGDDALACISYTTFSGAPASGVNRNIRFRGNRAKDVGSNGIHWAGATDCWSDHNVIDGTRNNGLIAQTDFSFGTAASTNIASDHDHFSRIGADAYSGATAAHGTTYGVYATAEVVGFQLDHAVVTGGTDRGIVSLAQSQRIRDCEVNGAATSGYLIDGAAGGRTMIQGNVARLNGQHGYDLENLTDASVKDNLAVDNSQSSSGTYSSYRYINILRGDYGGNESISTDSKILRHHLMTGTCSDYHWGVNPAYPASKFTVLAGSRAMIDDDPAITSDSTAGNYTLDGFVRFLRVTSTTAARTITLPAASGVPVGVMHEIVDESNAAGTNNITVTRAGTDTWLGGATSKVISTNGGRLRFYSNGTTWIDASVFVSTAATDVITVNVTGATTTIDLGGKAKRFIIMTVAAGVTTTTVTWQNVPAVGEWHVEVQQNSGGGFTPQWPSTRWTNDATRAPSTGASDVNSFDFWTLNGTNLRGALVMYDGVVA